MTMTKSASSIVFFLAAIGASAQVNPYKDPTPGVSGYRAEVLAEVRVQEDKFTRLAEAIPADKYTYRPTGDVRSIAEVFLHVAAANYNLPKLIGTPPPTGVDVEHLEKSATDKTKVESILKDSFTHEREAIVKMPDADLEKSMDWFGGKNTERGVLLFMVRHTAEHLGQSIAYARMVGVIPPWTEDQQRGQARSASAKDASKDNGAQELVTMEAEFMKATAEKGSAGYISYYAEDAVELPDGESILEGKEAIVKTLGFLDQGNSLTWTPVKADMAASGDLGYTYGNYEYRGKDKGGKTVVGHGKYMTVWKKQKDGSWKVALDMGNSTTEK